MSTFSNCRKLREIRIPESVERIDFSAFYNCTGLTKLELPDTVKEVGINAFSGCRNVRSIRFPAHIRKFSEWSFSDCRSLEAVHLPAELEEITSRAFYGCSAITDLVIPEGVRLVGDWTFYNCENLITVTLPESVTSIGERAFSGCRRLREITLPATLESLGSNAFRDCAALRTVYLPDHLREIGIGAVSRDRALIFNRNGQALKLILQGEWGDEEEEQRLAEFLLGEDKDTPTQFALLQHPAYKIPIAVNYRRTDPAYDAWLSANAVELVQYLTEQNDVDTVMELIRLGYVHAGNIDPMIAYAIEKKKLSVEAELINCKNRLAGQTDASDIVDELFSL